MAYSILEAVTETENVLGRGSYGEVIEVECWGTICAAKRLHDRFVSSLSQTDFEKECQTWSNLKHPNIVQLLGCYYPVGSRSRVPILVIEKMNTSLRLYYENHTKVDFLLLDKVSVFHQVAQGLNYLHSFNPPLIHHSLNPNNILLNYWTFLTKLTDFGMGRAISKLAYHSSGTLPFMPPEALYIPPRHTEKLDIFSYGACIATALTHQWPSLSHPVIFEGDQCKVLTELDRRQGQIDVLDVTEKELFLPLIKRCLECYPELRPNSKELLSEMRQIERGLYATGEIRAISKVKSQLLLEQHQRAQLQQQLEEERQRVTELEERLLLQERSRKDPHPEEYGYQVHQIFHHEIDKSLDLQEKKLPAKIHSSLSIPIEKGYTCLTNECPICYDQFPNDDMVTMPHCGCSVCKDCFKGHYSLVAREQTLGHFNCLLCSQPDLSATDIDKDDYLTLFSVLLKVHLPDDDYQLFQKKATDYALSQDANFRWCPSCVQGFIHEPPAAGNPKITCPYCNEDSCFICKKVWEEQHQGNTCANFSKWKAENNFNKTYECNVCFEPFYIDDMVAMVSCTCSVCKECFKKHYSLVAREQTLSHFNCLICRQPDLSVMDINKDDYLTSFSHRLKANLTSTDYECFQEKATNYALFCDPDFRWCPDCGAGFIHDPPGAGKSIIYCPKCLRMLCFYCKKLWEEQHEGVACVDFAKWKAENDEENQQRGLAAFLKEIGIECPKCHYRYDLAKGGCLHFTCTQCFVKTQFCGGCGSIYYEFCRKYKACQALGFHTHHPRDCLFYMRDWEVERLQKALEDSKIEFGTDPPKKQVNATRIRERGINMFFRLFRKAPKETLKCRVKLQKEVGENKIDEECGEDCEEGHAGLCRIHYIEYLVCKLNEASVDPADFMDLDEIKLVLGREEKELPPKDDPNKGDDDYLKRMREHTKKELPLEKRESIGSLTLHYT